jgi:hypothetical protein
VFTLPAIEHERPGYAMARKAWSIGDDGWYQDGLHSSPRCIEAILQKVSSLLFINIAAKVFAISIQLISR